MRAQHGIRFIAAILITSNCSDSPTGPDYDPDIQASDFVAGVSNPLFPLVPGTTSTFLAETAEGEERIVVEVLSDTRVVNGVTATVVRDRVFMNDELAEDTYDWYAQDSAGNVWYLGEDSKEIENGQVVDTGGSWEWGVDGALPGIIMWADPSAHVGESYRQEFYEDEAEDWGRVVAVDRAVSVPFGSFTGCTETEDWNALESGGRERKFYCPQIGLVLETPADGGNERVELVERTSS
ncbi:MAG: hypothetical protein ACREL7_15575 [Longimicrobiales bacterium]